MPFMHGKFVKPGTPSMGKKITPGASSGPPKPGSLEHAKVHGAPQAPHGATSQEKHVKETHPGSTQPHPETGVHAFHAHHTGEHGSGGAAYTTHTHHDDGTVETKENRTHDEMLADQNEAFPQSGDEMANEPAGQDKEEYAELMNGVGGEEGSSV